MLVKQQKKTNFNPRPKLTNKPEVFTKFENATKNENIERAATTECPPTLPQKTSQKKIIQVKHLALEYPHRTTETSPDETLRMENKNTKLKERNRSVQEQLLNHILKTMPFLGFPGTKTLSFGTLGKLLT